MWPLILSIAAFLLQSIRSHGDRSVGMSNIPTASLFRYAWCVPPNGRPGTHHAYRRMVWVKYRARKPGSWKTGLVFQDFYWFYPYCTYGYHTINKYMFMVVIWIYHDFPCMCGTPKMFTFADCGHPVSKSWLKLCLMNDDIHSFEMPISYIPSIPVRKNLDKFRYMISQNNQTVQQGGSSLPIWTMHHPIWSQFIFLHLNTRRFTTLHKFSR